MTQSPPVKVSHLLYVKGNTCIVRYGVIISFLHLLQLLKMNMKLKNPATYEEHLVIRFSNKTNVCLVLIHVQIVELCGEGAINKGNLRKWCHLFKESSTMCSHTSPLIHAHYWTVQPGKFSSVLLHTVPILHQVIITCFSTSRNYWPTGLKNNQEIKRLVERRGRDLFWWRLTKAGPMTWQVPEITWRLCGEVGNVFTNMLQKRFLKILYKAL